MELIGRRFGHIRVVEVVGEGGMGEIYAGFDEKLQRKVALKALHSEQRLDGEARERLLREARALSRLDHPNICRIFDYIESGDVDVLVLEYIEGYTLHEALDNGLSHAEKMRIATAVAQVLVAAHRVGIIHRDLKPDNVMLTRTGEVKVLDFGLARWLTAQSGRRSAISMSDQAQLHVKDALIDQWYAMEDPETTSVLSADEPNRRDAKRRFLVTAAGVTMGTPLYMSPEQARGEPLTTASDMYSFGLMLQTLFTGSEPYPAESTAREVMIRASRGDSLPLSGVPRGVAALIARLKMIAPSDRPTAVETLGRLQWVANEPKRIVRYAVIALLAAITIFGISRYTIDLRHERAVAERARKDAEQRRAQAEDLISFMVGDLRTKLEPVGRLEILDDVATKTLEYIDDLDPERTSVGELARSAKALQQLGEVRIARGDTAAAIPLFEKSLALSSTAVQREPKNNEAQLIFGTSHFWLGNALRTEDKLPQALSHMQAYMRVGERLAASDPKNPTYLLEKAAGHSTVGVILEAQGNIQEALRHYETSLEVRNAVAEQAVGDTNAKAELARAINKVGVIAYRLGQLGKSRGYHEREVDLYRKLLAIEPRQTQWMSRLATSMAYLGRIHWFTGNADRAYSLWQEELAIEEKLAQLDPENFQWRRNVAITKRRVGEVLTRRGDLAGAASVLTSARADIHSLAQKVGTSKTLPCDIVIVETEYAKLLQARGETARARAVLSAAIEPLRKSTDRTSRVQLARALYTLGEVREAEQIGESLLKNSSDPYELDLWLRILVERSRLSEVRGVLDRIAATGYDITEVQRLCSNRGC